MRIRFDLRNKKTLCALLQILNNKVKNRYRFVDLSDLSDLHLFEHVDGKVLESPDVDRSLLHSGQVAPAHAQVCTTNPLSYAETEFANF
jgi:hypothetical protein